jgi:hypothetical protein
VTCEVTALFYSPATSCYSATAALRPNTGAAEFIAACIGQEVSNTLDETIVCVVAEDNGKDDRDFSTLDQLQFLHSELLGAPQQSDLKSSSLPAELNQQAISGNIRDKYLHRIPFPGTAPRLGQSPLD